MEGSIQRGDVGLISRIIGREPAASVGVDAGNIGVVAHSLNFWPVRWESRIYGRGTGTKQG